MYVHVAVPVPGMDLLTYAVPAEHGLPPIGARVVVPLGSRSVTGIVAGHAASVEARPGVTVRALLRVVDREAYLPVEVIALAQWTAEYYAAGVSETLLSMLPPHGRADRPHAQKLRRVVTLTDTARQTTPRSARQAAVIARLAADPDGVPVTTLVTEGIGRDLVARLARAGLVCVSTQAVERDPFARDTVAVGAASPDRQLTEEQAAAVDRLVGMASDGLFQAVLLHGITGSGKTEVYLRTAAAVCAAGRRVLMLVPEIALTPVLAALCRQTFGDRVAIQHSGLSDGERYDQWHRIRRGEVDVVVGTRSAVFTPLANLGLVIVDEEHDGSYKQEESPRYHARDVAIVRAQRSGALALLGSATPSLETFQNVVAGKYARLTLARRVQDRSLASVTLVDMREVYATEGADVVLSRALREALGACVARGEQAMVLLNRRGFATSVYCRQCAGTVECPHCSVSLVIHGSGARRRARCHYCDHAQAVPECCPSCRAPYLEHAGFGTERVEAEVVRAVPGARVARLDRDSIRRKGALADLLARFKAGDIDVLVGTQMIAKGHDFPRVTLVGVVSADVGLAMADFRAAERTFQLLTQVVGRAGRGTTPGHAIVQTLHPTHYSVELGCAQDYERFFAREIAFRTAMHYPPAVALINLVVRGPHAGQVMESAMALVQALKRAAGGRCEVLGPAPAPLSRLRGDHRMQVLVKGSARTAMRQLVTRVLASRPQWTRHMLVDVDPLNVL